jgi:hypothetical protein
MFGMHSSGNLPVLSTDISEEACTSETSVGIQLRTRQYIPEDSELHGSVSSPNIIFI